MKILTKSKKSGFLIAFLTFQLSLLSIHSQNFNTNDFTKPREITTIHNTTNRVTTRDMIAFGDFYADRKNDIIKVAMNQIIVLENIHISGDKTTRKKFIKPE
ncbi:hypothetical protein [Flavivirga eckloniae]|uniref:Organic solvent tolerance-like N-terminal domain-containing protein n=1 Tax=Flavivirga eckloniae TaxID=1803846 RepID=A0A2K9PTT3_9FLAO|nr:hypothetical protein [Flavivirga eckloniae]AUP80472.1 hypothetical protein C1H87_17840 [Flavivirga eckloniae]